MPRTRRGARLPQATPVRLSDFFPDENPPSPILARRSSHRVVQEEVDRLNSLDVPLDSIVQKEASSIRSQKAHIKCTPNFNPDIHGADLDVSLESDDEFVQSLTFSAANSRPDARLKMISKSYTVVHDYNSDDDDSIGLSPVKFSPISHKQSIRKINGTPVPARHVKATTRNIWDSTKKKVVERLVGDVRTKNCDQSSSCPRQAACSSQAQMGKSLETRSDQGHSGTSIGELEDRPALVEFATQTQTNYTQISNSLTVCQSLTSDAFPIGTFAEQNCNLVSAIRSPKVSLTRTMPGSRSTQTLEKLELPDFIGQTGEKTIRDQQRFQPFARLPKQTAPGSRGANTPLMTGQLDNGQIEALVPKDVWSSPAIRTGSGSSSTKPSRKRKLSESRPDIMNRDLPLKRARRIADAGFNYALNSKPAKSIFTADTDKPDHTSMNVQLASKLPKLPQEQTKHEKGLGLSLGDVPRSLYVQQRNKQNRRDPKSITKAAPFQFATAARSGRTLAKRETSTKQPSVPARCMNRVHALYLDPFVPKPSEHAQTIARSPMRSIPTRLETRREFDKLADEHAKQALAERRRELEIVAAERERAMEARKGWADAGKNAVEEWQRSRISESGKRPDWQD